ncbi:rho guanine nucleotide exchange factor 17 isoform X2 [Episyrphus balteatus]|nr:rho guanine nucleotide exchange factor 17 isoform X2 [Episyrphus balteatus]
MYKPRDAIDDWERQVSKRQAFHKSTKQEKISKSDKSEKLKELTELLKNTQSYKNQNFLSPNKTKVTDLPKVTDSLQQNFKEPQSKGFNNQSTLNEIQTKILNLKLSNSKQLYKTRNRPTGNSSHLTPLNMNALTKLSHHQKYQLQSASCARKEDSLTRSTSFSQIEQYSYSQNTNLKHFQDVKEHQDQMTTEYTENVLRNKKLEKILFIQLQYENKKLINEEQKSKTDLKTNYKNQLRKISLSVKENKNEQNLSARRYKQLVYENSHPLKTTTVKQKMFISPAQNCIQMFPVFNCAEQGDRNLKTFLLELIEIPENEISSLSNIKFESQNINPTTVPTLSLHRKFPVHLHTQVENENKLFNSSKTNKTVIKYDKSIENKKRISSDLFSYCFDDKSEEKIRTDKSKRRKGMYIDSTDWADNSQNQQRKLELIVPIYNLNHRHSFTYLNSTEKEDEDYTGSTDYVHSVSNAPPKYSQQILAFRSSQQNNGIFDGTVRLSDSNNRSFTSEHDINIYTNRCMYGKTLQSDKNTVSNQNKTSSNSQLLTQSQILSTETTKIDYTRDSDENYKDALDNLTSDTNSYLKLNHAVSESILSQNRYCIKHSPPNSFLSQQNLNMNDSSSPNSFLSQPNLNMNEFRKMQTKNLSSGANTTTKSKEKNNFHKDLFSMSKLLVGMAHRSDERLVPEQRRKLFTDTRTHIAEEIYRNEQSYVESLQTVVLKYLNVLKSPEYAGMIESKTVDEIFFMVPDILAIHEKFLKELKKRLDTWVPDQKVGDAFVEIFSKTEVLEVYTSFVNNCNRAKNAIRTAKQSRPSFARFLETTAREHKGKLTLDNLLIKPVQKFPNYEMLFTRLIKHTIGEHPDQKHLQAVLKLVHDILVHINCKEKEILENGQREATLREIENIIEGITDLITPDRHFIIFDLVSMPTGQGTKKERGFFLFNDFLLITSVKRKSGTIRKQNTSSCPASIAVTLDSIKYKFLTKVSLENLENIKSKEETFRRESNEFEQMADDSNKLQQIAEIAATIKYPHQMLDEVIHDIQLEVQGQLSEHQLNETRLNMLDITINSPNGSQHLEVIFSSAEKRCLWEEAFNEAKQKLAATLERHPVPEFVTSIPIVKTRAGLQFTCAEPTLREPKEVWVCNSDGYVGQVCVMSLSPEPNITSCNGVCNARILCLASAPAWSESKNKRYRSSSNDNTNASELQRSSSPKLPEAERKRLSTNATSDIKLDSNSSSDDSEPEVTSKENRISSPVHLHAGLNTNNCLTNQNASYSDETQGNQSTMWLGTEDGYIHVYNCNDTIRIKKNKIKIQHASAVYSILHMDNRIFISLANGDLCVYHRENVGWNTTSPLFISIGTVSSPVTKLMNVYGKLWCSIQGIIKVLDTKTLQVVHQIQVSSDSKPITNMALSCKTVWISVQNSANIKCFHANTYILLTEVNLGPAVNKMLSSCDDIIRQHKAACLRVTSLLSCKDLIWIGTSAGVLLTISAQGFENGSVNVVPSGIPYGHTGHVRFLTFVETSSRGQNSTSKLTDSNLSIYNKNQRSPKHCKTKTQQSNTLVISGGDGFEDFRSSGTNSLSEIAGREDSTNHLIVWQI